MLASEPQGVGQYALCGKTPSHFETYADAAVKSNVALAILDEFQGPGIGTILLQAFESPMFSARIAWMLDMFAYAGFQRGGSLDSGVVHLHAPTRRLLKT